MNQLEYIPGTVGAAAIGMDSDKSFVGIASNLRSRKWAYKLGYRDVETANRPAREVTLDFHTDYATADRFRRAADADLSARTPGTFIAQGEWKQRGYVVSSEPSYIHYGRLATKLGCVLLDGAWWRVRSQSFAAENTVIEDKYESATGEQVVTVGADSAPLHSLIVDSKSIQDGTPTPSNPVEAQVVGGVNLFDSSLILALSNWSESDGVYTGNSSAWGTASSSNLVITPSGDLAGRQFTVSFDAYVNDANFRAGFCQIIYTDTTADNIEIIGQEWKHYTKTTNANKTVSNILFLNSNSKSTSIKNPQLTESAYEQPYVPYGALGLAVTANGQTTVTPIDLQGNVLASLPDGTKDTLTVDPTGHVTLTKNVGVETYDGSNMTNWTYIAGTTGSSYVQVMRQVSTSDVVALTANNSMCSNGVLAAITNTTTTLGYGNSTRYVRFRPFLDVTLETAQTYLQEKPIMFALPLVTPATIDLGYITMPDVFDGATVEVIAEVTPTITAEWKLVNVVYLDYPHDYQYDYMESSSSTEITTSVLTPSDVRITIFGAVSNPYIIVGDNRYQVNVNVPAGGYLVIDGRDKTITLTLADGTQQNAFGYGVRGSGMGGGAYIFEPIKGGAQSVQWSGAFGFDLAWYEDEGEPPWSR